MFIFQSKKSWKQFLHYLKKYFIFEIPFQNQVDTYEGEVGVLEAALAKLQAHSWGSDHDHEALLEALSMDRGQQPLPPEKRQSLIHDILKDYHINLADKDDEVKHCRY